MISKLDLAAVFAAMACWVLSIEDGHHIFTDAPRGVELSAAKAAAPCPDNDSRPYAATCLKFSADNISREMRSAEAAQASTAERNQSMSPSTTCPDRDDVPYGASCIAFMTGWFWQPNSPEVPSGAVQP